MSENEIIPTPHPDDSATNTLLALKTRAESMLSSSSEWEMKALVEEIKNTIDQDRIHEDNFLAGHYQWQDSPEEHGPPSTHSYFVFYVVLLNEKIENEIE